MTEGLAEKRKESLIPIVIFHKGKKAASTQPNIIRACRTLNTDREFMIWSDNIFHTLCQQYSTFQRIS